MNVKELSLVEKLELAVVTTEHALLELLLLSPEMLVRRAMLRNKNITTSIVNTLVLDKVENVSYMASKHRKCTIQRTFEPFSKCVTCKVDERKLSCERCPYS